MLAWILGGYTLGIGGAWVIYSVLLQSVPPTQKCTPQNCVSLGLGSVSPYVGKVAIPG